MPRNSLSHWLVVLHPTRKYSGKIRERFGKCWALDYLLSCPRGEADEAGGADRGREDIRKRAFRGGDGACVGGQTSGPGGSLRVRWRVLALLRTDGGSLVDPSMGICNRLWTRKSPAETNEAFLVLKFFGKAMIVLMAVIGGFRKMKRKVTCVC